MMRRIHFKSILFSFGILLSSFCGFAQAPGGVSTGMTVWFKADNAATITGNPVSSWSSSGGSATGYTVTQSTTTGPALTAGSTNHKRFNFNPRIKFGFQTGNGVTALRNMSATPDLIGTNGTMIVVTDQNLDGTEVAYRSSPDYRFQFKPSWRFYTGANTVGYTYDWSGPTEYTPVYASMIAAYGCGPNMSMRKNSVQDDTPNNTSPMFNPAIPTGLCFGANGGSEPSRASMAEVIIFDNKPSLADMEKIETYLAVKYGITRGGNTGTTAAYNYISASNLTIWDKVLNTGYNKDITVIGREDASGLAQKQSISVNTGGTLTIALGNTTIPQDNPSNPNSFSADASFLAWGDDGQAKTMNASATKPSGITERLNTVWKLQSSNFADQVSFGFETSQVIGLSIINDLCLLFDDDGDFSNATVAGACSALNPSGARIEFAGITIPVGKPYVTLARVELSNFTASNNSPICAGTDLNLSVNSFPNTTYTWTGPNGFTSNSQNPVITAATVAAGGPPDYIVTSNIYGGCLRTASTSVVIEPAILPTISIVSDQGNSICYDSSASFTATVTNEGTAALYQWNVNGLGVGTNSPVYSATSFNNSDIITCDLTSNVHCAVPATVTSNAITLTVMAQLQVDAGTPVSINTGGQAPISATAANADTYLWTPSTGLSSATVLNPVASPDTTTTYTLTASNALGCHVSDVVTVTVGSECVHVRNAFTPNGDGINDLWLVYDLYSCFKNITVHVYNRYGSEVYQSKDYQNNWDGRYKGKNLPDGTYYGIIDFTLVNGRHVHVKTDLTILR